MKPLISAFLGFISAPKCSVAAFTASFTVIMPVSSQPARKDLTQALRSEGAFLGFFDEA